MNRQEFLLISGLPEERLDIWIAQGWIVPLHTRSGERFREVDNARARLIQELQRDLGANDPGIDLILHLMDQLHGARRALALLRDGMR